MNADFVLVVGQAINDVISQPPAATPKEAVGRIVAAHEAAHAKLDNQRGQAVWLARAFSEPIIALAVKVGAPLFPTTLDRERLAYEQIADWLVDLAARVGERLNAPPEPVKVDQRPFGCWAACIATLTGIDLDELPHPPVDVAFEVWSASVENRNRFRQQMHDALLRHGWFEGSIGTQAIPAGFALAGGMSPRGLAHWVVVRDGQLWHDPHESGAGLVGDVEEYCIIIRTAP